MKYRFSPCKPNPIILDKLASLSNVRILGIATIDSVEFAIIRARDVATIALDLSSGFFYPFEKRWALLQKEIKVYEDEVVDGNEVGEIVKCSFGLGRDEGQKRLRTVLDVPTDYKVLILSGGGIRLKDSAGKRIPVFSLLEDKVVKVNYDVIARMSSEYSAYASFFEGQGEEYSLARRLIEEENDSQGLFDVILSSTENDDEGSVNSLRDGLNPKTIEQEMHHHSELVR